MPQSAVAPIPNAGFSSMMTLEQAVAAGVPWPCAAIATRSLFFCVRNLDGGILTEPQLAEVRDNRLFQELRSLPLRPRIVAKGEHQPLSQRWMAVQPEGNEFGRVRVCQIHITQDLKCICRHFS